MQKIEDEALAQRILDKVNSMNGKMAIISTALSLVYALAPWKQ